MTDGASLIYVTPIGSVSAELISPVMDHLSQVLGADVKSHSAMFDADVAYDNNRNQYSSTVLLECLYAERPNGTGKVVGITNYDLFIPVLTFVFGEAQLGGHAAVASFYRLRNAFYGLADDDGLLVDRLKKEVVHELGHTFGLVHCAVPTCVMYSTTAVEEVDVKTAHFCPACRRSAGLV